MKRPCSMCKSTRYKKPLDKHGRCRSCVAALTDAEYKLYKKRVGKR